MGGACSRRKKLTQQQFEELYEGLRLRQVAEIDELLRQLGSPESWSCLPKSEMALVEALHDRQLAEEREFLNRYSS